MWRCGYFKVFSLLLNILQSQDLFVEDHPWLRFIILYLESSYGIHTHAHCIKYTSHASHNLFNGKLTLFQHAKTHHTSLYKNKMYSSHKDVIWHNMTCWNTDDSPFKNCGRWMRHVMTCTIPSQIDLLPGISMVVGKMSHF